MENLIIVGAGGFGREVFSWIGNMSCSLANPKVIGFLDDDPESLDGYNIDVPIIGGIEDYVPKANDRFVMAIGQPRMKLEISEAMLDRGAIFETIIHSSAILGNNVSVGQGCVLCPFVVITTDVTLGDFVTLNVSATVGHDAVIGDGCTISSHSDVTGFAKLGKGVFLGSHATIGPMAKVGDFAKVGIGSTVLGHVKPGVSVFGVPAKKL